MQITKALAIGLISAPIWGFAAYALACWLVPPLAGDGVHKVMPIGQVIFASLVALAGTFFVTTVVHSRLKKHK